MLTVSNLTSQRSTQAKKGAEGVCCLFTELEADISTDSKCQIKMTCIYNTIQRNGCIFKGDNSVMYFFPSVKTSTLKGPRLGEIVFLSELVSFEEGLGVYLYHTSLWEKSKQTEQNKKANTN